MKKYTYSKTVGNETFSAVEFDSFDEAIHAVDKGIRDAFPQGIPTPDNVASEKYPHAVPMPPFNYQEVPMTPNNINVECTATVPLEHCGPNGEKLPKVVKSKKE